MSFANKMRISKRIGWVALIACWGVGIECKSAAAMADPDVLDGTWNWTYTNADGYPYVFQFKLQQKGERVAGTMIFPRRGEEPVAEGTVDGDRVEFKVSRKIGEGNPVQYLFSGRLHPGSLTGTATIKSVTGTSEVVKWDARRAVIPADSLWTSVIIMPDGSESRWRFLLRQQDDAVLGRATAGRVGMDIRNGRLQDGIISFEAGGEAQGMTNLWLFEGKITGYNIQGKATVELDGDVSLLQWTASRPQPTIEGTWEWVGTRRRIILQRQGDQIAGRIDMENGVKIELRNLSARGLDFGFEGESERDGLPYIYRFRVRLENDRLLGTIERILGDGRPQPSRWEGRKLE